MHNLTSVLIRTPSRPAGWLRVAVLVIVATALAAPASAALCGAMQCPPPVRTPCTTYSCVSDGAFKRCVARPAPQGYACSDGNGCTTGDACDGTGEGTSACKGRAVACDTPPVPACQSASGVCTSTGATTHTCSYAARNDGAVCDANPYRCDVCSGGRCVHATGKSCDDGSRCTFDDRCTSTGGCTGALCADGAGCAAGSPALACYSDVCNTRACNGSSQCSVTYTTSACSDGDACTVGDRCASGSCVGGAPLACDSPPSTTGCWAASCDPARGCTYSLVAAGTPCNDGNDCTTADVCGASGVCVGTPTASCPAQPCACAAGQVCIGGVCTLAQRRSCACSGWQVCTADGLCADPAEQSSYRVGACYHDTGAWQPVAQPDGKIEWTNMHVFIRHYHEPGVRQTVQQQLRAMADSGASLVKTILWWGYDPSRGPSPDSDFLIGFPPTAQEMANLHDYVVDVATTLRPNGLPMELDLSTGWNGAADISVGDYKADAIGTSCLSRAEFLSRVTQSYHAELDAVKDVFRKDGQPAVTLMYFFSEVQTCATDDDSDPTCQTWGPQPPANSCGVSATIGTPKHNQQWLLANAYPAFVAAARNAGIIPSVYFNGGGSEWSVMNSAYADEYSPLTALRGHGSMANVYRSAWWMKQRGLELPARFDLDFSPNVIYTSAGTQITRLLDDLEAVLPSLYGSQAIRYGIVETAMYLDATARDQTGKAWAAQRLIRGSNPEVVAFWSTPNEVLDANVSPSQFDFAAFSTGGIVFPFANLNGGFETSSDRVLPDGWTTPVPAAAPRNAYWNEHDATYGQAELRFDAGLCASGCAAVASDYVAVSPGQTVVFVLSQQNGLPYPSSDPPGTPLPSDPAFAGMLFKLVGSDGSPLAQFGGYSNAAQYGTNPPPTWSRYMGVARVPGNVGAVRLQIGLQNEPSGTIMNVDQVH